jgi:hypothetical protein
MRSVSGVIRVVGGKLSIIRPVTAATFPVEAVLAKGRSRSFHLKPIGAYLMIIWRWYEDVETKSTAFTQSPAEEVVCDGHHRHNRHCDGCDGYLSLGKRRSSGEGCQSSLAFDASVAALAAGQTISRWCFATGCWKKNQLPKLNLLRRRKHAKTYERS